MTAPRPTCGADTTCHECDRDGEARCGLPPEHHGDHQPPADVEIARLRNLVQRLVAQRTNGRLRRNPALWEGERPDAIREAAQVVFEVLADGIERGGVSSGWVVERLREKGIPVTISCLHGRGLQVVANATCGEDDS